MSSFMNHLKKWAYQQLGLVLSDKQLQKIHEHIKLEFPIPSDQLIEDLQKKSPKNFEELLNMMIVNESYFFRDRALFRTIEHRILPEVIEHKKQSGKKELCIWSAGVAKGEELYSLIMLLDKKFPEINQTWDLTFVGTDINFIGIEQAKKGRYSRLAMRSTPEEYQKAYFSNTNGSSFDLDETIKQKATLKTHNLLSEPPLQGRTFDIIVCRNVFIYLHKQAVEVILKQFHQKLSNHGILIVGPSDFISFYSHSFQPEYLEGAYFYRKKNKIQKEALTSDKSETLSYSDNLKKQSLGLLDIKNALKAKQYNQALSIINDISEKNKKSPLLLQYKAQALLMLNDQSSAIFYLDKAIEFDPHNAKLYYFKGLCDMDAEQIEKAVFNFKKAISINAMLPEVYYYLAILYFKSEKIEKGFKALHQAFEVAKKIPSEKLLLDDQTTISSFLMNLKTEMDFYKGHYCG